MTDLTTRAHAKINLCLFAGPTRPDGRHELVTVMDSLTLCDDVRLTLGAEGLDADEVLCDGVDGPNLAAGALAAFRARTGWDARPVRLQITKRIPVAGGMAGGSADAAAALRLAAEAAGVFDTGLLEEIGESLGADVPSQVRGGLVLATGTGERLRPLHVGTAYSVLVLVVDARLAAGAVYAEADRLGLCRDPLGLARALTRIQAAVAAEALLDVVHNDLQDAARSLCPAIDDALEAAIAAGADHALVSGSGPTVLALFGGAGHAERAAGAQALLTDAAEPGAPAPLLAHPVDPSRA